MKQSIAGNAPGDWRSFPLRERNMREAGGDAACGLPNAQQQLVLLEVRDECSFGDFADGVGYGYYSR